MKTDVATTDEQGSEQTKTEAFHARAAREDLRAVVDTPAGRRFVWRLLGRCHLFHSAPAESVERFEGERNIGHLLMTEIEREAPKSFLQMWNEGLAGRV